MLPPSGSVTDVLAMVVPTAASSGKEPDAIAIEVVGASFTSLTAMSISEVVIFSPSLAEIVML